MATAVIMPKAGMAMEQGTISRWLKKVGDPIKKGEPILEIETDKVSMEVEAEVSGVLLAILEEAGAVVPVIQTIAWIGAAGEAVPAVEKKAAVVKSSAPVKEANTPSEVQQVAPQRLSGKIAATPAAKTLAKEKKIDLSKIAPTSVSGVIKRRDVEAKANIKVTPLARKMAVEREIDLQSIKGTGVGGKITVADIEALPRPATKIPLVGMRKVIAQRMCASTREIPEVTLTLSADVTTLLALRAKLKAEGKAFTVNDFILCAVARALSESPMVNATLENEVIHSWPDVNLGVAVGLDNGLVVPVLRKAQKYSLADLAVVAKQQIELARNGKLMPDAFLGGTFTITNLGMFGVEHFNPIINLPQVAILGICAAQERLFLDQGQVKAKTMMPLCLTHDHRVVDGVCGMNFLNKVKGYLENPAQLMGISE
jgi:pyruvate dehydrogenase E2 component (dihydrolipoamide acetyltransferase)